MREIHLLGLQNYGELNEFTIFYISCIALNMAYNLFEIKSIQKYQLKILSEKLSNPIFT